MSDPHHTTDDKPQEAAEPVGADVNEQAAPGETQPPASDTASSSEAPPEADNDSQADETAEDSERADNTTAGEDDTVEEPVAEEEPEEESEAAPMGPIEEIAQDDAEPELNWYILKVQVNREDSIRAALERRIKVAGLERYFDEIVVPTEDVVEFTKTGKKRLVKRKLYPGYLLIRMAMTDDAWFLVRETPGVGDFTGSSYGTRPSPMDPAEVERIINVGVDAETGETQVKTAIPFKPGDRVRVKEGNFENFEGEVESIDEANGRVTVIITIFGRSTPVELEHWHIEAV